MRVTTYRSYILPFKYKGWDVSVEEKAAFWHDAKVKVTLKADKTTYLYMVVSAFTESISRKKDRELFVHKVSECLERLCNSKSKRTFYISANGGMLDRFLGQNSSAMKKIKQKIIEYIDTNIGVAISQKELLDYLKQEI